MPISATGKRDHGFTLVELMAVIAIIAVATAAVVLSWPGANDQTRTEAVRFAARVALARDLAITNVRPVGLIIDQRGYRFEQRSGGVWRPIEKAGAWGEGVQLVSDGAGERLVFDPVGLADHDQSITLTKGDQRTQIVIAANGGVNVAP
jgi:general secretion pathway protein H